MREPWRYIVLSWRWFRAYLSLGRIVRDLRSARYHGQPLYWHPKAGLYVKPRTMRWTSTLSRRQA